MMKTNNRSQKALPWAFLAAAYALVLCLLAVNHTRLMTAEAASDLMLARQLNAEHGLLAHGFRYLADARLFGVVNLYQLGLLLFPSNWTAVRLLAMAVLLAGLAASFLYMAKGADAGDAAVWAAGGILLPLSAAWGTMVSFGGTWLGSVIIAFLGTGLVLRLMESRERVILRGVLLLGLSFLQGMQGTASLLLFVLPCLVTGIALFLRAAWQAESIPALLKTGETRLLAAGLAAFIAAMVGFVLNVKFLAPRFGFETLMTQDFRSFTLAGMQQQLDGLAQTFGWIDMVKAASARGLLGVLAVVLTGSGIICLVLLALRGEKLGASVSMRVLMLMGFSAMAMGMAVNTMCDVTGGSAAGLWLTGVLLMVLAGFTVIRLAKVELPGLKVMLAAALALMLVVEAAGTMLGANSDAEGGELFTVSDAMDRSIVLDSAAQVLMQGGYAEGLGLAEDAGILTALSNGRLEVWVPDYLDRPGDTTAKGQLIAHADTKPQGRCFLVYTGTTYRTDPVIRWMGREPDWQGVVNDTVCLLYTADSYEALTAPLLLPQPGN